MPAIHLSPEQIFLYANYGVLPFWARLAIAERAASGATYAELTHMFNVARSTVYRAIHRPGTAYCILTGVRHLTACQAQPVNSSIPKPVTHS